MDFKSAKELLEYCNDNNCSISTAMKIREISNSDLNENEIIKKMETALNIMKEAAYTPLTTEIQTRGGLIGGEAHKLNNLHNSDKSICSGVLHNAIKYSMAVLEINASMGLIVAAPTAGSSGVLPGVILSLANEYNLSDDKLIDALFNAGAIGYLAMRNATVAGAVGGCQAETGVAAAMAASAAVELMSGTPAQCLYAASTVIMNMLGLVCDPVSGLVEYPCQNRNAAGAANALVAAEISLAGIKQLISFDDMLDTMYKIGINLPESLRETATGGCANCCINK